MSFLYFLKLRVNPKPDKQIKTERVPPINQVKIHNIKKVITSIDELVLLNTFYFVNQTF